MGAVVTGPPDEQVRERVGAGTRGNPLDCWSYRVSGGRPSSPAGSGSKRCRRGSRTASADGWTRSRWRRAWGRWTRRPSRRVTRCCRGRRPRRSASSPTRSAPEDRQRTHRALAQATDTDTIPTAAPGPCPGDGRARRGRRLAERAARLPRGTVLRGGRRAGARRASGSRAVLRGGPPAAGVASRCSFDTSSTGEPSCRRSECGSR
jgi:hypothetical protein